MCVFACLHKCVCVCVCSEANLSSLSGVLIVLWETGPNACCSLAANHLPPSLSLPTPVHFSLSVSLLFHLWLNLRDLVTLCAGSELHNHWNSTQEFFWEFFLVFLEGLGWLRGSSMGVCEALCEMLACKKGYTNTF